MLVIHHNDLDGRCAGAVVYLKHPEAELYEINYGQPLPFEKMEKEYVVFVDFSPETEGDFNKVIHLAKNVVWIDHHITAIEKYPELNKSLKGKRADTKPSGAELAWKYFWPSDPVPVAVRIVSDYDTWTFAIAETKSFHAGMCARNYEAGASVWSDLLDPSFPSNLCDKLRWKICNAGEIVLKYRETRGASYVKSLGHEVEFAGHKAIACNIGIVNSSFFDSVADKYDLFVPYYFDGNQWTVSLYTSRDDLDVSQLAKERGGGGHPKAAGFQCDNFPWKKVEIQEEKINE